VLDLQQSLYRQQSRAQFSITSALLFIPCQDALWTAGTSNDWQLLPGHEIIVSVKSFEDGFQWGNVSSDQFQGLSPFAQSILICTLASQLPARENSTYLNDHTPDSIHPSASHLMELFSTNLHAQTILALHYTPLHDLLAVVRSNPGPVEIITSSPASDSAQARLSVWASSFSAAAATHHACRVISLALKNPEFHPLTSEHTGATGAVCISDYWTLRTAVLICWVFCHGCSSAVSLYQNSGRIRCGFSDNVTRNVEYLRASELVNEILELSTLELSHSLLIKEVMAEKIPSVIYTVGRRVNEDWWIINA
jgi:hypothetical protein